VKLFNSSNRWIAASCLLNSGSGLSSVTGGLLISCGYIVALSSEAAKLSSVLLSESDGIVIMSGYEKISGSWTIAAGASSGGSWADLSSYSPSRIISLMDCILGLSLSTWGSSSVSAFYSVSFSCPGIRFIYGKDSDSGSSWTGVAWFRFSTLFES